MITKWFTRNRRSHFRSEEGRQRLYQWYDQVQQESRLTYENRFIPTRYGLTHLALSDNGKKETVVFIHGWSCNGMLWEMNSNFHQLGRHYNLCLVDLIGQPTLSNGLTPPVRGNGYAFWLMDILEALNLPRASLVGMSFGAFLIIKLAAVAPERIKKAALLCPAGFSRLRMDPRKLFPAIRPIIRPNPRNIHRFIQHIILSPRTKLDANKQEILTELFSISFGFFNPGARVPYRFSEAELRSLKAKSLVVIGEDDAIFPAEAVVRRARKHLPSLTAAHILKNCGHALEDSERLTSLVSDFLLDESRKGGTLNRP